MKKLIIVGTGLFAEVAASYFTKHSIYQVTAFSCHEKYRAKDVISGLPLVALERLTETHPPAEFDVFVAIGYGQMNKMRARVYAEVKTLGYQCATFVHPNVEIWDSTTLGDNVFIFEDNTIQPFTRIGNNTVFWSGNHLGHHSVVGDHNFISSHVVISGSCVIGNHCFLGVNATLRDSIEIADECLIGAGAIIMKNTAYQEVYVPERTRPYSKTSEEVGF